MIVPRHHHYPLNNFPQSESESDSESEASPVWAAIHFPGSEAAYDSKSTWTWVFSA